MKQISKFISFVAFVAALVFLFTFCEKDRQSEKGSHKRNLSKVSVLATPKIAFENASLRLKSATVSQIDSIEVYFYYLNESSWTAVSADNFNSGSEANLNFKNPLKLAYADTISLPYVVKAQCKFVFQGYDLNGNKTFRGQVEEDLRDAEDGWIIPANLFETKSYLGLKVLELVPSEDSCVFDYQYVLKGIDSALTLNNLGTFTGPNFPNFYLNSSGDTINGQLIIDGKTVLLNGVPVNYSDYIDISENWNKSAPEGIKWTVKMYRAGSEILASSLTGDWLSFGENNYIQIINSTSGSSAFTIIRNDNVYDDWKIIPRLKLGLVAYYSLDETSGTVIDATGNGNNGTNNGATAGVLGKVGNAYGFNGSNNYISLVNANVITNNMLNATVSVWVNTNSLNTRRYILASGNGFNSYDETLQIFFWDNNTLNISFFRNGGVDLGGVSYNSSNMNTGEWYHIVSVLSNNSIKLYLNGVKVGSTVRLSSDPVSSSTNMMAIGRFGTYNGYYFDGSLDEVGIWNRALSQEEISRLYNSGQGLPYSEL